MNETSVWQAACTIGRPESIMQLKIRNGTSGSDSNLCHSCRYSTITRGHLPSDEIVQCEANPMQPTRIHFKVASCTAYFDGRLPTYMQLVDQAWILQPGTRKRRAGFVRGADLRPDERARLLLEDDMRPDE
jgi:hypothetical protein